MPQLNPTPWFAILSFAWVVFLLFLPSKVTAHNFPNELSHKTPKSLQMEAWTWPWH